MKVNVHIIITGLLAAFVFAGHMASGQCDELRRLEKVTCTKLKNAYSYDSLVFRRAIAYTRTDNKPFTGEACSYYADSTLQKLVSFKGGILNGTYKEWHDNGKLKFKGSFKNNILNGNFTYWYADGQVEYNGKIEGNMRTGLFESYHENGQKAAEGKYVEDERSGPWTEWYENGGKAAEGSYEKGEKTGEWSYWDEQGNEIEGPVKTKDESFEEKQIELYKIWKNQTREDE